ncbi:hypothetical protein KCF3NO3_24990 [Chryseobacterium sp. KCF3-3]
MSGTPVDKDIGALMKLDIDAAEGAEVKLSPDAPCDNNNPEQNVSRNTIILCFFLMMLFLD